ncbi:MAG: orotidine-5'-phosphate decarboxylase [Phycisphaerales bacterium]|jgi:orotidine-5'-phosphate decarboxylase
MSRPTHPADALTWWVRARGGPACIGLDPVLERLPTGVVGATPVARIQAWCLQVLDAVEPAAAAVKFQSACFERWGSAGVAALEHCLQAARGRFLVILDWKRGDIGISSEHYAAAVAPWGCDFVTASPYLGRDAYDPFLKAGLGVFALVRTSNATGDAVQAPRLADGRSVAEMVGDELALAGAMHRGESGWSSLGAVVGATKVSDARSLRGRLPHTPFLVPGFGAQGGGLNDALACFDARGQGALITASRSVIYAHETSPGAWQDAVAEAARALRDQLAEAIDARMVA